MLVHNIKNLMSIHHGSVTGLGATVHLYGTDGRL